MSEMLSFSILLPLCLVNFHIRKLFRISEGDSTGPEYVQSFPTNCLKVGSSGDIDHVHKNSDLSQVVTP